MKQLFACKNQVIFMTKTPLQLRKMEESLAVYHGRYHASHSVLFFLRKVELFAVTGRQ